MRRNLVIALTVAVLCASIVYNNFQNSQVNRVKSLPKVENPEPPQRSKAVLKLANDRTAGRVVQEVERVARPSRAAFAISGARSPRLACVFVESPERFFQLDLDLNAADFAALNEMNFAEPPEPLARTISRYRSVSKTAMDYNFERGDRLIVLLCPVDDWEKLKLECTNFAPPVVPDATPPNKTQF